MLLYNTLSRKKDEVNAMDGKQIRLYTCGPTVYDFPHVGNMRAYVLEDLLKRSLLYFGFAVKHVMNITDVGHLVSDEDDGEDKMEKGARRENKSVWEVADMYTQAFFADVDEMNILHPDIVCKATDHIPEQIALVKTLTEKGYTYAIEDGIYFDTSKWKDYGKLAKLDVQGLEAGKRVEVAQGKKNITDFALWKFSPANEQRQMEWIFDGPRAGSLIIEGDKDPRVLPLLRGGGERSEPEGSSLTIQQPSLTKKENTTRGFPGWHIECSAMAMKHLGESFDLHAGGVDHIPVHHTNEIAQAEAVTGKQFVRHWFHVDFLQVEGKKMSKSLGNFYTISGLREKGFSPRAIRFLYLSSHYRAQQNFTLRALEQATNTLEGIDQFVRELGSVIATPNERVESRGKQSRTKEKTKTPYTKYHIPYTKFDAALSDDLNVPQALSVLFDFMKEINPRLVQNDVSSHEALVILDWLERINEVLGVFRFDFDDELSEAILKLVQERGQARKNKDFSASDRLRGEIEKLGYEVKDTAHGQKVGRS